MSEDSPQMTSHRPYLLRALYEWIVDNGMTPHLLVDATRAGVQVPTHAVKDGKVVLNVAERAVSRLEMDNDAIRFSARFGGVSHPVSVPVPAVLAIYARETGQGMFFPEEAGEEGAEASEQNERDDATPPTLSAVPSEPSPDGDGDGPSAPSPRRGGHLRVVK
ncbi:ClpXP protease specificity-enhancing factor [Vulcaniibacterium tengchongense]|uniref:Stringent starvation protein B n=1 Tax=Vulcaniibacterium tengchongense TaxID=1273429 RepID=A0A3N4W4T0_9GAMM|nr:ClpXP protease specificity-enhancing factor [Vulcaniibacterium tengchongense]RPE81090.1 stringent starvation protein B [Vulcaniibacterium tengchongense]